MKRLHVPARSNNQVSSSSRISLLGLCAFLVVALLFSNIFSRLSVIEHQLQLTQPSSTLSTVTATPTTAPLQLLAPIDAKKTQLFYQSKKEKYGNRADFVAIERFFGFVKSEGLDNKDSVVLVGGTNRGQLSQTILKWCPTITFFGFEIQPDMFQIATETLKVFVNARVLNLGWDEQVHENVPIGGKALVAGLFDPKGQRGWKLQPGKTANTVVMADWIKSNNIHQTLYVVIDTEGYEPKVIRGMRLHLIENQKTFPIIQYELGGTWAANDNRHGNDVWDQKATAQHFQDHGYLLFLTGKENWLAVNPGFFDENNNLAMLDEGFGPFIQGNVLAMHTLYCPPTLATRILNQVHIES